MRFVLATCMIALVTACTPGADHSGIATPTATTAAQVTTIEVNLTLNPITSIVQGQAGGYSPVTAVVKAGTAIRFVNTDSFTHTATEIGEGTSFPAASPFGAGAIQQSGSLLSQGFSSGALAAGAGSQLIIADKPGTYLYGCFFHYGSPMRAAIVVQ